MSNLSLWVKIIFSALGSRSNQQFYDRISPIYDQVFTEHKLHAVNITNILSSTFSGREASTRVIDLGCGTGILSCMLAKRGFDVTGMDISLQSLSLMHKKDSRINAIQSDADALPIVDKSASVVVCLGAWRHFPEPKRTLAEISRILTKDGIVIIGYFPPALAGAIHHGKGMPAQFLTIIYEFIVKIFGYIDRPDMSLESETVTLARQFFKKTNTTKSGERWNLIVSSQPAEISPSMVNQQG